MIFHEYFFKYLTYIYSVSYLLEIYKNTSILRILISSRTACLHINCMSSYFGIKKTKTKLNAVENTHSLAERK